ncbi:cell division protein FtsL [Methylovirgula sp. 4M-Z18]|uniref:cell division protein FtsL n=1 Tax=Methylovirgula sp. 4M-Z18 TaxID=2293567 RepID=UPI000E2F05DC|nr:hypothetical protein [Methylovirgula sp. 4M-Z18]RFB79617.1 hypothetical protein DYH55_08985 [Methylovirgula sp. 4M-Z18]
MWRIFHLFAIAALIGSAVYAYSIKYETIYYSEQIVKIQHEIDKEHDQIGMLRAEWAHLTRPERIQKLADQHLQSQDLQLSQIVRVSDLPDRGTKIDDIGRKLDDLGLAVPTNTPAAGKVGATATTTTSPR